MLKKILYLWVEAVTLLLGLLFLRYLKIAFKQIRIA